VASTLVVTLSEGSLDDEGEVELEGVMECRRRDG
jgi:hypothetical protein